MENQYVLYHYGVKGMKWGVRRFQNKDGTLILKKGTTVKRISNSREDPTYDNKKYVSINEEDHRKWDKHIAGALAQRNVASFVQTYTTVKDLRVMDSTKQGKLYANMLLDSKFSKQALKDTEEANKMLYGSDYKKHLSKNNAENISRNIAAQTSTGKKFVEEVLKQNYDALLDTHGTNVAKNPLIVLNPDSNLARSADPEYTQAVKDYIEWYSKKYSSGVA